METFTGATPLVATFAALVALCAAGAAGWLASRAWPISMRRELDEQADRVRAVEAIVEGLTAKWTAAKADLASVLEDVEAAMDSIERKRRRIAASESKAKAREEAEAEQLAPDPKDRRRQLLALARARGINV